nr:hypothetical protein [Streptomyces sp. TLI_235]
MSTSRRGAAPAAVGSAVAVCRHQNSRGAEEHEWITDQEHIPRFDSLIAEAKWWNWNHDAQVGWSDAGEMFEE